MTQLIVALDIDRPESKTVTLFHALRAAAGVTLFKINAATFMMRTGWLGGIPGYMRSYDVDIFLDLKVYDTRDTVERIARHAFVNFGVRFLTVHATPSMLEAAMRAKPPGDYHKVLAVGLLTDGGGSTSIPDEADADGFVCSVDMARNSSIIGKRPGKIVVCPGIRPHGWGKPNHINPATPSEAKAAGADFIGVGRPIIDAPDPVAAARAIMEDIA